MLACILMICVACTISMSSIGCGGDKDKAKPAEKKDAEKKDKG